MTDLVRITDQGLYCQVGGFHIDPWLPVERAVITHAHSDHARPGSDRYLTSASGAAVLRARIGSAAVEAVPFGETRTLGDVRLSLHPAGHLLGSAQVRIEHRGRITVISGDYKVTPDATCEPFQLLPCHHFITESTFGLPVYRWPDPRKEAASLNDWWRSNAAAGVCSVVFAYSLGKAQRVLAALDAGIGSILLHGAVERMTQVYRDAGVALPTTLPADAANARAHRSTAMVIAPLSVNGSPWMRKFKPCATAMVSGWMAIRGRRRFRAVDRGFVLSDHADWDGLLATIRGTGAERVGVTHGYRETLVRYLTEQGHDAHVVPTRFEADDADDEAG